MLVTITLTPMPTLNAINLMIQYYSLGIGFSKLNINQDVDFVAARTKGDSIRTYFNDVEVELKAKDSRYTHNGQIRKSRKYFKGAENATKNIRGKYYLNIFKYVIR